MSNTIEKMPLATAQHIANQLADRFAPHCERIVIAGSIRRNKAEIGDIELVCIPKNRRLHEYLDGLMAGCKIEPVAPKCWGEKWRSFVVLMKRSVRVDVFMVAPETWGVHLMIRTGSGIFSRNMVSPVSINGFMPELLRIQEGRVWLASDLALRKYAPLETPEEEDVFKLWGMEFVEPRLRMDTYKPAMLNPLPVEGIEVAREGQLSMFGDEAEGAERWTR